MGSGWPCSGGGLNTIQKQVLNIMESGTADEPGELTPPGVRKQLLALEKGINKNRDMRTKHGDDPEKYVLLVPVCFHHLTQLPQVRRLGVRPPRKIGRAHV